MPIRPAAFPSVALRRAQSPSVLRLFEQLVARADQLARMQHEFSKEVRRHRGERERRVVQARPASNAAQTPGVLRSTRRAESAQPAPTRSTTS